MGNQQLENTANIDFVTCPLCGHRGIRIYKHIKIKHDMSVEEFRIKFPNCPTTSDSLRKRIKDNTKKSLNEESVVAKRKEFRSSKEGREMASRNAAKMWTYPESVRRRNEIVSKRMKELWSDPVFHENQSKRIKEATNTEEVHKKHHDRLVRQWEDKDYRIHITECVDRQFDSSNLGVLNEYTDIDGKKVMFRSSWELSVHNILLELGIEHLYEVRKFIKWFPVEGKLLIYRPDFYIPSVDMFLEVKPYKFQSDKINLMKRDMVLEEGCRIEYVGDSEYNDVEKIKSILGID